MYALTDTPQYRMTNRAASLAARIAERAGSLAALPGADGKGDTDAERRIDAVYALLALAGEPPTRAQTADALCLAPETDVSEAARAARNVNRALVLLPLCEAYSTDSLLLLHNALRMGLSTDAGAFRTQRACVFTDGTRMLAAPPGEQVFAEVCALLRWAETSDVHPLIKSCVVHCELLRIQPFSEGSGVMACLWQRLLLTRWRPAFARLPVETQLLARRAEYRDALYAAGQSATSAPLTECVLGAVDDALGLMLKTDQEQQRGTDQVKHVGKDKESDEIITKTVEVNEQIKIENEQVKSSEREQEAGQDNEQVSALLRALGGETLSGNELMARVGLKHRPTFRKNYLQPALNAGVVEMTAPDKPNSSRQKYRARRS